MTAIHVTQKLKNVITLAFYRRQLLRRLALVNPTLSNSAIVQMYATYENSLSPQHRSHLRAYAALHAERYLRWLAHECPASAPLQKPAVLFASAVHTLIPAYTN